MEVLQVWAEGRAKRQAAYAEARRKAEAPDATFSDIKAAFAVAEAVAKETSANLRDAIAKADAEKTEMTPAQAEEMVSEILSKISLDGI